MTDAMEPLLRLRSQVSAVLNKHGLALEQFAVAPSPDGVHEFQIGAVLPEGWDRTAVDDAFDEVIISAKKAEIEQRAEQTRTELQEDLRRSLDEGDGGIL